MRVVGALAVENGVADIVLLVTDEPDALRADTRNWCDTPLVRPLTMWKSPGFPVDEVIVTHPDPSFISTRYPMMGAPPSPVGIDHSRATEESPATAATRFGSVGTFTGVEVDGTLGMLSPSEFTATTRTDTGVPFDKPVITADVDDPATVVAVDHAPPPIDCSMRYTAIGRPPLDDGGFQDTDSWLSPGTSVTAVATLGTVAGATVIAFVATPAPTAFTADTRNW